MGCDAGRASLAGAALEDGSTSGFDADGAAATASSFSMSYTSMPPSFLEIIFQYNISYVTEEKHFPPNEALFQNRPGFFISCGDEVLVCLGAVPRNVIHCSMGIRARNELFNYVI